MKHEELRKRFEEKFLATGVDSSQQFKEEVRGKLPSEFLTFLFSEVERAEKNMFHITVAELSKQIRLCDIFVENLRKEVFNPTK